jgi:putative FmdB family regulatory protein
MPLYEYECEKCGARFEVIQRFSDAPIATCRVCEGPVHKLISPPAIQFKGTGWYITDYAKKNGTGPGTQTMPGTSSTTSESAPAAPANAATPSGEAKKG